MKIRKVDRMLRRSKGSYTGRLSEAGWKKVLALFLAVFFMMSSEALAGEGEILQLLEPGVQADGLPKGWEALTFRKVERHTEYRLSEEDGKAVILAESNDSASGLIRHLDLDPESYQTISWCWKVKRIISNGDATQKEGDDYAARIYVTFKFDPANEGFWERTKFKTYKLLFGSYPPKRTLNYVWANRLPKGKAIASAYTDRSHMVAVQSGEEKLGEWVCEKKNLLVDYLKYFGEAPPHISGIAVMTDTDNTGESASAAYSKIVLLKK